MHYGRRGNSMRQSQTDGLYSCIQVCTFARSATAVDELAFCVHGQKKTYDKEAQFMMTYATSCILMQLCHYFDQNMGYVKPL